MSVRNVTSSLGFSNSAVKTLPLNITKSSTLTGRNTETKVSQHISVTVNSGDTPYKLEHRALWYAAKEAGLPQSERNEFAKANADGKFNFTHGDPTPKNDASVKSNDLALLSGKTIPYKLSSNQVADLQQRRDAYLQRGGVLFSKKEVAKPTTQENYSAVNGYDQTSLRRAQIESKLPGSNQTNYSNIKEKAGWQQLVSEKAGINSADWNPERGFEANRQTVERVYGLYEQLHKQHPELQWAGMAKLAGGVVYGGLEQIKVNQKRAITGGGVLSGVNPAAGIGTTAFALGELNYMETKLLTMQKRIFDDLAWQHAAYSKGGIGALEAAHQRGEITKDNLNAWKDIASGDKERIQNGNMSLLDREQFFILEEHYEEIRNRPSTGGIFAGALSRLADSPVPGGRAFSSSTGGDITVFADRWKWIEQEIAKPYLNLSPEYRTVLNNQPLRELANRQFAVDPLAPIAPKPQPHPTPTPQPR